MTGDDPRGQTLQARGRIDPFDGLRGVAIVLVVMQHATALLWPATFERILPGGFIALDLFFVLSGYLITTLILERRAAGEPGLSRFYIRRALRILPAVGVMVTVVGAYTVLGDASQLGNVIFSIITTLLNFASWILDFFPSWFPNNHLIYPLGVVWSLAVEERFYVVWPAVLLLLLRLGRTRRFIVGFCAVGVVLFAVRCAQLWQQKQEWTLVYPRTDARAGELLVGAGLALLLASAPVMADHGPLRSWARAEVNRTLSIAGTVAMAVFALGTFVAHRDSAWLYRGGFTVIALVCAVIVAAAADGRTAICRPLSWPPIVVLGRMSYSIYLWHYPIFDIATIRYDSIPVRFVVAFGLTTVAVAISYNLVECPAMNLRHRLVKPVPRPTTVAD